jgi:predicted nucleic acid-binding protein
MKALIDTNVILDFFLSREPVKGKQSDGSAKTFEVK